MKSIFKLKYLPTLLIAPILACCITLYANASESEDQSVFDKIVSPIENNFNALYSYNDNEFTIDDNALSEINDEDPLFTDDGLFTFEITGTDTANIAGYGYAWTTKQNPPLTTINVPVRITYTPEGSETTSTYRVTGINREAFKYNSTAAAMGNKVSEIIVNGWDENGNGGWLETIGSQAFSGYDGKTLTSVTLPNFLESIGYGFFNQDTNLTTINKQKYITGEGLTTEIGLPENLKIIDQDSFADCRSIIFENGTLNINNNIEDLVTGAFFNCSSIKHVIFNTNNLDAIGGGNDPETGCFENCTGIETVDFTNCTNLSEIRGRAFYNCSNEKFTELLLPAGLTELGNQAFMDCYSLDNIQFPNSLEKINAYCFSNDKDTAATSTQSKVEYLYLPEATMYIGKGAFQNSQNLKEVVVGMKTGKAVGAADDLLDTYAFANCPSLVSVTFLWDVPWQLKTDSFINSASTDAHCGPTPGIDVRFRPLDPDMAWLYPSWYSMKNLDNIFPDGSLLCISACFSDDYYGNDLENYFEVNGEAWGADSTRIAAYDNETFATYNKSLNHVQYKLGVSIPDTLKIHKCTDNVMKSKTKAKNSKTMDFVYDNTQILQTFGGEKRYRDADDGILNIGNFAIQVNVGKNTEGNTLNVTYTNKHNGTKPNTFIYGHTSAASNNPFQSTYNYLTAEADQIENNDSGQITVSEPKLRGAEEDASGRFFATSNDDVYDMDVNNACIFFCRSDSAINISNIAFGGPLVDPITKEVSDVENICQLSCVYNSGTLQMQNCTFKNTTSTWSSDKGKDGRPVSFGGSCVFNFGTATVSDCAMENCLANLDGGAVMNADVLTIKRCSIKDSSAKRFGGAIYDNIGDESKGVTGKIGIINVDQCDFINCKASYGGAIKYRNTASDEPQLTLSGSCLFSGNTDLKGVSDDLCLGPKFQETKTSTTAPFVLSGFGLKTGSAEKLYLSAIRAKVDLVLSKGIDATTAALFDYKNEEYNIELNDDGDMVIKTKTITYTLATTDENGSWVDENGNTVTEFTAAGKAAPEAGQVITYTDADGASHTITATAADGYEFTECEYNEQLKTFTATFKAAEQNNNNLTTKIKESIKHRNDDPKEALKTEIYGK